MTDASSDLAERWPAIRRLAARQARAWDVEADDLAQATALFVLLRLRNPRAWLSTRLVHLCCLDAIPMVRSPESRAGRFARFPPDAVPSRATPARGVEMLELCALPPDSELEDPADEDARHRAEWGSLSLRERQERIAEAHRALGTSWV